MDTSKTLDEIGCLSSQAEQIRKQNWKDNAAFFQLAYALNIYGHKTKFECKINGNNILHVVAISLYLRILNSYASLILLTERNLEHDAEAIARVALEALFYLKRIIESPSFVEEFVKSDQKNRLKLMNLAKDETSGVTDIFRQDLKRFDSLYAELKSQVEEEEIKELKAYEVAEDAGLKELYNYAYRTLCQSVHPNPRSLSRYVTWDKNGEAKEIIPIPISDSIPRVLGTGIMTLIMATRLIGSLFGLDLKEFEQYERQFSELSKEG